MSDTSSLQPPAAQSQRQLERRPLGTTGLQVVPLAIGAAALGSMPEIYGYAVPRDQALETIRAAFRSPIQWIDTAASYGDGESERHIGGVLREIGGIPDGFLLSTKAGGDLNTCDFSGDQIRRSVERNLRLLALERLDLVFLHDPERTTSEAAMEPGGPVEVLQRLHSDGVIRHIGVAGGPPDLLIRFVESGIFEVVITHNRYTLLNNTAEPVIQVAVRRGLGVLNAAPYGSGMLAKGPGVYCRPVLISVPFST